MKINPSDRVVLATALVSALLAGAAQGAAFTPGNILVTRSVGGTVDTTSSPTPGTYVAPTPGPLQGGGFASSAEIDEYTPSGTFVQAITLPNVMQTATAAGTTYALTYGAGQNNEGTLTLSGNGKYFTTVGYNQTAGVSGTNSSVSTTVQRVVGIIGLDGSVNTTTGLQDVGSKVSIRSAYTSDGTSIWVGGSNGSGVTINGASVTTNGVRYTTVGSTTSTPITGAQGNQRSISAYNFGSGPQLLLSSNAATSQTNTGGVLSGTFRGLATIDTGLPTTETTVVTPAQFPGFSVTTGAAAGETADNYWFKDANTVYIADQRDSTAKTGPTFGGVQKWTFQDTNQDGVADSWVFNYNITLGTGVADATTGVANPVGAHGLTGMIDPVTGKVDIFVTTFDNGVSGGLHSTYLREEIDNGTSFTDAQIAQSAASSAFLGVSVVPYLMGDANNDGKVDLNDLNTVLNHLGQASYARADGNFDNAATIDLNDLNAVLNNLGQTFGGNAIAADVPASAPEPASLGLLGVGLAGVLLRRRRA